MTKEKEFELSGGNKISVPEVEADIYKWFTRHAEFRCAWDGDTIVGFVIYNPFFNDTVMVVHVLYVRPEYEKMYVGKALVDSISSRLVKILFQTFKEKPPTHFLNQTENYRKLVSEDAKLLTWEMPWIPSQGGSNG